MKGIQLFVDWTADMKMSWICVQTHFETLIYIERSRHENNKKEGKKSETWKEKKVISCSDERLCYLSEKHLKCELMKATEF